MGTTLIVLFFRGEKALKVKGGLLSSLFGLLSLLGFGLSKATPKMWATSTDMWD